MATRNRIAVAAAALTIVAVSSVVHAQFSPPTCVPPSCNPTVIQNIDVVTGSAQSASINVTGSAKLGGTFQTGATPPTLTLATENLIYGNVGGTSTNASLLLLQYGGADRFRVTLAGQQTLPLGSVGAPSYSFVGDTNTGIYSSVADSMSFVTGGVTRLTINNSSATLGSGVVSVPTGSAGAPSYTFTGDTNTGMYRSAADTLNLATNGVSRLQIDSTGAVTIPGNLTVSGTFTSSGGLGGDGSAITNLNATNITSGTLADARLSANVALLNANQTFTGINNFTNGNSTYNGTFTGSGAALTTLNASQLTSGTVPDARLSANIALLNANQTFTGSNIFSGITSHGSAALVVGGSSNLIYGNVDTTSTGNLLLLQTESADRFRVTANGDVTATSFSGVGSGLTSLNASNLSSGTVPSARISGTYANNLTFSGMTSLGSAALVVSGAQNLLYGNIDTTSTGSLLLLQTESVDRFRVAANGDVTIAGNLSVGGSFSANGSGITNINASNITTGTLADARLSTNVATYSGGGTFTGVNVFNNAGNSFTGNGAGLTSLNASNITTGTLADARLSSNVALLNGVNNFTGTVTIGGQGICLLNGTNCPMSGSGTANYVTKWTGANTLGNALIQDNGTSVAIANTPAANTLLAIGPTNLAIGFSAVTNANSGVGVYGFGLGTSAIGVYGQGTGAGTVGVGTAAGTGVGVQGSGQYAGVTGAGTGGASSVGVQGTGPNGVTGIASSVWGYGVQGYASAGSYVYGVFGNSNSNQYNSAGVAGTAGAGSNAMGGYFQTNNASVSALYAYNGLGGLAFTANGTSIFTGGVSMNSTLGVAGGTNLNGSVAIGDAAADVFIINSSAASIPNGLNFDSNTLNIDAANNRVGIGTASPQRQLSLLHATDAVLQLTNNTAGVAAGDGLLLIESGVNGYVENGEAGNLILRTAATDRVTIDSSGNVGIGYAPSYKLDVNGRAFFEGEIAVGGDISSVWTGYGVASSGSSAGGHFYNTLYPSVYGALGYQSSTNRYGVYGSALDGTAGTTYAGYFTASGGTSYGVYANGVTYGVYANGSSYGLRASGSTYGVYSTGTYGGYFAGSSAYAYIGYSTSYGVYAYNPSNAYGVYSHGGYYGVYGEGAVRGGDFYDTSGTAHTFIAGAAYGVEIITGDAIKPSGSSWQVSSDARVKKDVSAFSDGLDIVRQLHPVNFTYNGLGGTTEGLKGIGFIAQDVKDITPYMVHKRSALLHPDDAEKTDLYTIEDSALSYINLNATKELDLKIVGLEAKVEKVDELDAKVKALETRVERLESEIETLKSR